ncbi:hypothetical protein acdb102_14580 [Acidothermaceae bacterium B102]|nr:hypothetical protein acdb102_14580 [Acidothermaceae bacterium B102]
MKTALDLHRELLSLDVAHEIIKLPRPVLSADELPEVLGVPQQQCLNVRLFVAGPRMIAVGLPVGRQAQLDSLLRAVGSRTLRTATVHEVNEATDFAAGLVPPLPLPREVTFLVDASIGLQDVVYTATGDSGTALGIRTAALLLSSEARVADLTTPTLADVVVDLEV